MNKTIKQALSEVAFIYLTAGVVFCLGLFYMNMSINAAVLRIQPRQITIRIERVKRYQAPVFYLPGGLQPAYGVDATQPALGYNMIQGSYDQVQTIN